MAIVRLNVPLNVPTDQPTASVLMGVKNVLPPWETWRPMLIGDWVESVKDVPQWLLNDIFPADSNVLMTGLPKLSKKSWMSFLMAMAVATGVPIGHLVPAKPVPQGVLIIEAEDGRAQTANRWKWLAKAQGVELNDIKTLHFSHRAGILLDQDEWVETVVKFVQQNNIKLVIVDTLAMHMQGDENEVRSVTKVMRAFSAMRQTNASVLFLHHLTKMSEKPRDIDQEVRGSSAIIGFYDAHWAFRQKDEDQEYNDLTIRSKAAEEKKFRVWWDINEGLGKASVEMQPRSKEDLIKESIELLTPSVAVGEPMTRRAAAEILGIDDGMVNEVLNRMIAGGILRKEGRTYIGV